MPTATLRALTRFRFTTTAAAAPSSSSSSKTTLISTASLHTTRPALIKDSLKDRTKIDRESNEYSKSGSDDQAASKDTAFKPDESNPQEEMGSQEKSQGDPLNVSPGNHDISQPVDSNAGGAEKGAGEQKSSGGGSPAKGKKVT
ncbi:MAG: hypothetical protein GOMPHAMPRED_001526 [Gomphillus americanus]|uniref:Uncharacterized protein n=1 Tax=Gomphillus americanus TaxID=1940652 RepID=A0A8H3F5C9_9LECA|nr:MAG: hypothetical protein GOMPHAMPRED_001526 [Gomphillus americanus]